MMEEPKLNVLIIDDEKGPRELLKLKLIKLGYEIPIHLASDIAQAKDIITNNPINIIFLDMNLGGEDGINLYSKVNLDNSAVIFSTAYPDYAIKAIQKKAAGYILKPFIDDEIKIAFENAINIIKLQSAKIKYEELLINTENNQDDLLLTVVHHNKKEVIRYNEIKFIQAADKYSIIIKSDGGKLISSTNLGKYKKTMEPYGFIDCHKSYLVNKKYIKSFSNDQIFLHCGTVIPISRRKKNNLYSNMTSYKK